VIGATFNWRQASIEVVVIVVGVLVALGVDEWWGERENRATETEYLARLVDDIQADIETFRRLERIFERKAAVITDLRSLSRSGILSKSTSELVEELSYTTYVALPDSRSTTFDELLSTGRLGLIESIERRDRLSRYYSGFEHISGILFAPVGNYRQLVLETLPPELFKRDRTAEEESSLRNVRAELDTLVSNPAFVPAANAEVAYANNLLYYLRQYRIQAEEILDLLSDDG